MTPAPDATSPASQVGDDLGSFSQEAKIPTVSLTLLPCPFCGGTEYHRFNSPDEFGRPSHGIQCATGDCWIVGPECETAEEAQAAWNRRPPIGEALAITRETLEKIARATPESTDSETAKDMAEWAHCAAVVGLVSAFSKDGIARQQAATPTASQPVMSEANAPIPAVQSGAVAWRECLARVTDHLEIWAADHAEERTTETEAAIWCARQLLAAPQSEPLPGEVGEADVRLIAVRDALLVAGGADPSNGVCRFSYWNLDKLNKAFDLALAALSGKEQG